MWLIQDVFWFGSGVATLFLAFAFACIPHVPPLNDFGEWVYQAYLVKLIATKGPLPFAVMKNWPVPNCISEIVMSGLMLIFPPLVAAKLFISAYLLGGGLLAFKLCQIYEGRCRGEVFLLLVTVMVLPTPLWTGETNYQVALLLLMAYIFWISRVEQHPHFRIIITALFGILIFFSHAICLIVFVLFVILNAVQRRMIRRAAISLLPAGLLSLTYLYFNSRVENTAAELSIALRGLADVVAYRFYVLSKLGPYSNMIIRNSGDFDRAAPVYYTGVALNLIFAGLLIWIVGGWFILCFRNSSIGAEAITALFCTSLYLWNPTTILRVATIGERFLLPAVLTAILLSAAVNKARMLAALVSGTISIYILYWLIALPKTPSLVTLPNNAISSYELRYRTLYWHRPYLFAAGAEAAESAHHSGRTPSARLSFTTSILTTPDRFLPH